MSEILLFTLVAVALYFFSDWVLRRLERMRGKPFKHRQAIYFVIILILTMGSFEIIGRLLGGG
jgi:predicted PurR-regulated permease PerM